MITKHTEERGFDPLLTGMIVVPTLATLGLASYLAATEVEEPIGIEYKPRTEEVHKPLFEEEE